MATTTSQITTTQPPILLPRPSSPPSSSPTTDALLPTPHPAPLQLALQTRLHQNGSITPLAATLRKECTAVDWEGSVKERVLQILRNGEVKTRKDLVALVVREALEGVGRGDGIVENGFEGKVGGKAKATGKGKGKGKGREIDIDGDGDGGEGDVSGQEERITITFPARAITAGAKVVREAVETFVELEPEPEPTPPWSL